MKIFYINLARSADKRKNMRERFTAAERLPAVDGKFATKKSILPYAADRTWRDPSHKRRMTRGEVGCILSHIRLWEKCVKLNEPIIVLEDDVIIKQEDWLEQTKNALSNFDFVYINNKYISGEQVSLSDTLQTAGFSYWTCAYAITPKVASLGLKYFSEHSLIPADEALPLMLGTHRTLKYNFGVEISHASFKSSPLGLEDGFYQNSDTEKPEEIWPDYNLSIITVATDTSKARKLFASRKGWDIENLGENVLWEGGNMEGPGGGQKINLVKNHLLNLDPNDIVLFLDGYDTFVHLPIEQVLERYFAFKKEILFSAEPMCWPDKSIANDFPETGGYKYLNSGTYIGTAKELLKMFDPPIENYEDDQLYCQKQYLTGLYDIALDYESYVFFCLSGLEDNIKVTTNYICNTHTHCTTAIIHGNGGEKTKKVFDQLYNKVFTFRPEPKVEIVSQDILIIRNFLTEDYCRELISTCEEVNGWTSLPNDAFPAQETRLKTLNSHFFDTFEEEYNRQIVPVVEKHWFPLKMFGIRDLFALKYSLDRQTSLKLHHDMSLISGSLKLNNDYEGGELSFPRQNITNKVLNVGDIILWPAQVTHPHECEELIKGTKYSLTLWTARMGGDTYGI